MADEDDDAADPTVRGDMARRTTPPPLLALFVVKLLGPFPYNEEPLFVKRCCCCCWVGLWGLDDMAPRCTKGECTLEPAAVLMLPTLLYRPIVELGGGP